MKRLQGIGFERVGRWLLNNEGLDFEIDRFADKTNILYAFICSGAVKYVGKSTKSLQTRMGQYRNPGSDQITNIGNNRRILETLHRGIDVEIYVLPDNGLIRFGGFHVNIAAALEDDIIRQIDPEWNGNPPAIINNTKSVAPKLTPPTPHKITSGVKRSAIHKNANIRELQTGTIEVLVNGIAVTAMPELRKIASELNIGVLNGAGNPYNTRQLGTLVLSTLAARNK